VFPFACVSIYEPAVAQSELDGEDLRETISTFHSTWDPLRSDPGMFGAFLSLSGV
jgi:hypothetical protein